MNDRGYGSVENYYVRNLLFKSPECRKISGSFL
jgi:hypothetical protein